MKPKRIIKNRGVTMVELIVSFALLSVFLAAATMCMSHAIIFHYNEMQSMSAYTVADAVLSEIKDEIRTMQGSEYNGYIKIREKDVSGGLTAVSENGGTYTGSTLEFVTSSINNGANAVQIDTEGCSCPLIDKEKIVKDSVEDIDENYLTMRYYNRYPEKKLSAYKNLFMDTVMSGSSAEESTNYSGIVGNKVVWHVQEKLPKQMYQNYTISLEFTVRPRGADSDGNRKVDYVDVTVVVNNSQGMVYEKSRRIELQNTVYYRNGNTMYSDGPGST